MKGNSADTQLAMIDEDLLFLLARTCPIQVDLAKRIPSADTLYEVSRPCLETWYTELANEEVVCRLKKARK